MFLGFVIASLISVPFRILIGMTWDKYGFKHIFNALMVFNVIITITAWFSKLNPWCYMVTIMFSRLLNNGIFTLFPISVT